MKSEWQPIAIAPKDERIMLCLQNRYIVFGKWDRDEYSKKPRPYWNHDLSFAGKTAVRANQPTHWMPVPEWP